MKFWKWVYNMIKDITPYVIYFTILITTIVVSIAIVSWFLSLFINPYSGLYFIVSTTLSLTITSIVFLYTVYSIGKIKYFKRMGLNVMEADK